MELGHGLPNASKKGEEVSIQIWAKHLGSVNIGVQRFPFGYVLFQTPSFLLSFSFRWFVLGISCHVPFVLISRVWRPLFIFLHLYFGPCSRDVGIYFPILCACIVHDVCLYIPACPLWYDCHSQCHLRQAMPNFHCESKVTCRQIFTVEIQHFARMPQESIDWDHTHSKAKPQNPMHAKP